MSELSQVERQALGRLDDALAKLTLAERRNVLTRLLADRGHLLSVPSSNDEE